jgi:hypothetical protein
MRSTQHRHQLGHNVHVIVQVHKKQKSISHILCCRIVKKLIYE